MTGEDEQPLELTSEQVITEDELNPETGENGTGEGEVEEVEGETEAEQPKKGKSVQERIDELYGRAKDAERDAEYWRLKALEKQPEKQPEAEILQPLVEPDPNEYDYGEDDPAYRRDVRAYDREVTRREVAQEFENRQKQQELSSQIRELETNYAQRLEAVREELPDYDEKVTRSAARGEWPCPELVALAIRASEVGPKVAYHLATNREEAVAISRLAPVEQAMAFGRLEARFQNAPAPQPNIATNSPTPPPARTKGGQFAPAGLDDRQSTKAWIEARNRQLQGR